MSFNSWFKGLLITITLLLAGNSNAFQGNLFDYAKCYVDSTNSLSIDEVSAETNSIRFDAITDEIKKQSFTNFSYWLKLDPKALTQKDLYIISKNVFIDKVRIYVGSKDNWKIREAGLLTLNEFKDDHSVISLKIPEVKHGEQVFISFQSDCISMLDIWIVDEITLTKAESFKFTFYSVILMIILIYLFIVLFLYFFTKTKGLPHFILYGVASVGMILFTNGYLYQYGPNSFLPFYKWSFVYFVNLYWGAAALLSYKLLKIDTLSNGLKRTYYIAFIFLIVMSFTPLFMPRQVVAQIHFIIPSLFIFFNVIIGILIFFKYKNSTALLLSIGWLVYFGFLMVWSLSKTGIIPTSFFVDNCPVFGLTFEFILFGVIAAKSYINQYNDRTLMQERIKNIENLKTEVEQEFGKIYDSLSDREREVLQLLATGFLDKEISDKLDISVTSVRTYSKRIYTKLNVSNRTEASLIYNKVILTKSI